MNKETFAEHVRIENDLVEKEPVVQTKAVRQAKVLDCPFCGAPKSINKQGRLFWIKMMARLGIAEWRSRQLSK